MGHRSSDCQLIPVEPNPSYSALRLEEIFYGPQSLTRWQFKQKFPNFQRNSFPASLTRKRNRARECDSLMNPTPHNEPHSPLPTTCCQGNSVARLWSTTSRVTGISRYFLSVNDRHQRNTQQLAHSFSQKERSRGRSEQMGGEVLSLDWAPLLRCLGRLHSWAKVLYSAKHMMDSAFVPGTLQSAWSLRQLRKLKLFQAFSQHTWFLY